MMKKNKRVYIAMASAQDTIITISHLEFRHGSNLFEEDGRVVDPLRLGSPCHAIAAYLSQRGAVLPHDEGHGGAEGGGGRGGGKKYLRFGGTTDVRQQSIHHGRSSVYESDEKRDTGPKAYPGVKYIVVDVVQKKVERKCEPAELAVELDMPGVPLSHAIDSETEVKHYYDDVKEEVLAVQESSSSLSSCLRRRRGTSTSKSGRSGARREEGVLKDADEPHLPTFVPGMYWMASRASNRLHILIYKVDICNSRLTCVRLPCIE